MADNTREELYRKFAPFGRTKEAGENLVNAIQSEITKAQEQLLDELEAEKKSVSVRSNPMPGSIHRSYSYDAIPLSVIEAKRKELKDKS